MKTSNSKKTAPAPKAKAMTPYTGNIVAKGAMPKSKAGKSCGCK